MRRIWARLILAGLVLLILGLAAGCFLLGAPPSPENLSASDGEYLDQVVLIWSPSRGAQRYEVFRATEEEGDYERIGETAIPRFADPEASPNVLHWYRVRACNNFGCSPLSRADSGYRLGPIPPRPPENVQASDGTFSDRIRISWSPSLAASSYRVFRSDVRDRDFFQIAETSATSHEDQEVVRGRIYWYKVKACNEHGCSDFSVADSGAAALQVPAAPQNVQASDGTYPEWVRVTWSPVTGAGRYEVHRAPARDGDYELLAEVTGTSYDDTQVTVGTTYWYRVRAWNILGYGPFSEPDSGYAAPAGGGGGGA